MTDHQLTAKLRRIVREELANAHQQGEPGPHLLRAKEVARRLECSVDSLRHHRKRGLPTIRVGNRIFFVWTEVVEYFRQQSR